MIRTVGLVAKYQEPKAADMVRWLVPWLKQRGKKVLVENGHCPHGRDLLHQERDGHQG